MNVKGGQVSKRDWNFKASLLIFERQVLVFPLLVVVLACTSFLWGGRCALWQWWASIAAVVGTPFLCKGKWREALGAAGLFAGLLVVLKGLLPPIFWDNAFGVDTCHCHFPMVQLLIEGWNPVADPLAKDVTARLGLDWWGMAPLHVAFSPKPMAVFSAVSHKYVGDPTSMTVSGLALLWLGLALETVRAYKGGTRWVALGSEVVILPLVFRQIFVDLALAVTACGLLFTMERALHRDKCEWLPLSVYTVWMMTIKLNGAMAALVFWTLFIAAKSMKGMSEWRCRMGRYVLFGACMTLACGMILWNPLMTSWQAYGHPLYPYRTADAAQWPIQDLTWDMRMVNDNLRQMGKVGIWTYEYVSPRIVKAYYRWKLGNNDFDPRRKWVPEESFVHGRRWLRPALWILFAILLLHPQGRWFGMGGLFLTGLFSWDKIGYTRYEPWLSSLGCLALTLGFEWLETRGGGRAMRRWRPLVVLIVLSISGGLWLWRHARDVEFKAEELRTERDHVRCRFWRADHYPTDGINPEDFVPRYNYLTAMENHGHLLAKQLRWKKTQVSGAGGWRSFQAASQGKKSGRLAWTLDERQWLAKEEARDERDLSDLGPAWCEGNVWDGFSGVDDAEVWVMTPWQYYYVPWGDRTDHIEEYYLGGARKNGEGWVECLGRRAKDRVRTWFQTYPREAWSRLTGGRMGRT